MAKKSRTPAASPQPEKRGRGRPKNPDPPKARQIGRIHDDRWEFWKRACEATEQTFTEWASEALDNKAKLDLRKHGLL